MAIEEILGQVAFTAGAKVAGWAARGVGNMAGGFMGGMATNGWTPTGAQAPWNHPAWDGMGMARSAFHASGGGMAGARAAASTAWTNRPGFRQAAHGVGAFLDPTRYLNSSATSGGAARTVGRYLGRNAIGMARMAPGLLYGVATDLSRPFGKSLIKRGAVAAMAIKTGVDVAKHAMTNSMEGQRTYLGRNPMLSQNTQRAEVQSAQKRLDKSAMGLSLTLSKLHTNRWGR